MGRGMGLRLAMIAGVAATVAGAALAQPPQSGPPPSVALPAPGPLALHRLAENVYWAEGGVGAAGVIIGDKGVVLVDATISEASARALTAEVARLTPKPITTVVLTHGDIDHVGGLAGLPPGVTVIAHPAIKARMAAAVAAGRSRLPADRLPSRTVASREAVTLEGVKVELLHWAPAHTDGDLVVYLPATKVVFAGDILALDQPRALIHREQQGTSDGWVATMRGMLALDAERFVPGHGQVQDRQGVAARLNLVAAEKAQIAAMVGQKKPLSEIEAAVGDPPPGWTPAPGGPRFTPFAEVVYQELTQGK